METLRAFTDYPRHNEAFTTSGNVHALLHLRVVLLYGMVAMCCVMAIVTPMVGGYVPFRSHIA